MQRLHSRSRSLPYSFFLPCTCVPNFQGESWLGPIACLSLRAFAASLAINVSLRPNERDPRRSYSSPLNFASLIIVVILIAESSFTFLPTSSVILGPCVVASRRPSTNCANIAL